MVQTIATALLIELKGSTTQPEFDRIFYCHKTQVSLSGEQWFKQSPQYI